VILETSTLTKRFGGLTAIDKLNFALEPGELRCLLGPNGAGKTTLFNLITGREKPTAGEVRFKNEPISHLSIPEIARKGIGRKFQVPNVYDNLTVHDNIAVALLHSYSVPALFRTASRSQLEDRIIGVLGDIGLADRRVALAGFLSHGEKQWLEIGMVLASQPELLLFDEPTAGMTADETRKTTALIRELSARRFTILVIGHEMSFIRAIARKVTVLHKGRIIAEGDIRDIERDRLVRDVYLGKT
jgi:urea transport system ATP-binding protein